MDSTHSSYSNLFASVGAHFLQSIATVSRCFYNGIACCNRMVMVLVGDFIDIECPFRLSFAVFPITRGTRFSSFKVSEKTMRVCVCVFFFVDGYFIEIYRFNNCFGVLGVLDRFHGTDSNFRATRQYARHIMMLSLAPAREVFPDPNLCKHKYGKQ